MLPKHQAAALAVLTILSASATASPPAAQSDVNTLRLTDDEKDELLRHHTEATVDAARTGGSPTGGSGQVHGVKSVEIGLRGSRSVFGAATIPLSDNAQAAVSFEDSRYGGYRRH